MDDYIRFGMISGEARFSKISIFSDLNNLNDISMENAYSEICGWTEEELVENFRFGIESLANEREENPEATIDALRDYYDGYVFSGKGSKMYNPFSVLKALKRLEIRPYWFELGTPTFLAVSATSSDELPETEMVEVLKYESEKQVSIVPSISETMRPIGDTNISNNVEAEAMKVIRGDYGVGQERKDKLGTQYRPIQNRVNQLKREGAF